MEITPPKPPGVRARREGRRGTERARDPPAGNRRDVLLEVGSYVALSGCWR